MRAFIAGATGYTGRGVVRELHARNVAAVAHVRPDSSQLSRYQQLWRGVAEVDTTPWQPDAMRRAMQRLQPTHVFALLGTTRSRAREARKHGGSDSYETVDYGLTAMLLQAVQGAGLHSKFIYLSSIGARENTGNAYLEVRGRMERELGESGVPYVIAQPAFITGADREEFRLAERALATVSDAMLGIAAIIGLGSLRDRFHSLTGEQLGRALVTAALDPKLTNVKLGATELRRLAGRA